MSTMLNLLNLKDGQQISKWEYKQLQSLRRSAKAKLQKEIQELNIPKPRSKIF